MRCAIWIFGLAVVAACTQASSSPDAKPGATPAVAAAATLGPQSHLGIKMTPEIRACRDACWVATPYNACADQRDTCYGTASSETDRRHCRHMAHTCRKVRRKCLQGCWTGQPANVDPLGAAARAADDGDGDGDNGGDGE